MMALAGVIGAPLIWLAALQTGYVLAYQACDVQSRAWVTVPTIAALGVVIAVFGITWAAERRARAAREPQPFLAWMGIGVSALIVIVMLASSVAPLVLRPCD